jgi:hypothetical protein
MLYGSLSKPPDKVEGTDSEVASIEPITAFRSLSDMDGQLDDLDDYPDEDA